MTDTQLDQLLAAANRELLGHIEATADPRRALTAIMTWSTQELPSSLTAAPPVSDAADQLWAAVMIIMRVHARDLEHELDLARELARNLDPALGRDLARELKIRRGRAYSRALDYRRAGTDHARALGRDLAHELDIGRARDLTRELTRELDNAHARANGEALIRARELGHELDSELHNAIDGDRVIDTLLYGSGGHSITATHSIHDILASHLNNARELARDLDAQRVDASGADLSDLDIRHLDVLDRIIWTRRTAWPPQIADQVEARSEEIRPGVYQIHFGNTSDRHALTLV